MDFSQFAILGGAAAILASIRNYISLVWSKISSYVITTVTIEQTGAEVMLTYLVHNFKQSDLGHRRYIGGPMRVKTSRKPRIVYWKVISGIGGLFWQRWRPVWLTWALGGETSKYENSVAFTAAPKQIKLSFVRGVYKTERLLADAATYYDMIMSDESKQDDVRHFVKRVVGRNKKMVVSSNGGDVSGGSGPMSNKSSYTLADFRASTPVNVDRNLIGTSKGSIKLSELSLTLGVESVVQSILNWYEHEQWYTDRGVPWRESALLYGRPGTGKTSLARAIAETLDLPVYVYDLSSLANDEMQYNWQEMLSQTPCMALIEDIDAVFSQRENKTSGELTFDCLLNCLDGIERAEGLLTIITTNNLQEIDVALGVPTSAFSRESTRPGRIKHVVSMTHLDRAGRHKMAERILKDWPSYHDQVVREGHNETGDQFQQRCFDMAVQLMANGNEPEENVHGEARGYTQNEKTATVSSHV